MHDYDAMTATLRAMPRKARREMLNNVIQNMHELDDADEIARILIDQLGGDADEVVKSYAQRR